MLAVLSGHTECVCSLLNKGANVEAKDKWGRTALHRGVNCLFLDTRSYQTRATFLRNRSLLHISLFLFCFSFLIHTAALICICLML